MINNFLTWLDVMMGNRPRRHFWQALGTGKTENNLTSPWAIREQRSLDSLDTLDTF
jgi:hypothetical protein